MQRIGAALAFLVACLAARAQAPAPLPDPNIDLFATGTVRAIVRLADGSVVIGGSFTTVYDPASQLSLDRANLAKFSAAGALDLAWNPGANQGVYALATDASGAVYAGGDFTQAGGQPRNRIAKLAGTGSGAADAAWNPDAQSSVLALASDGAGALYVGGFFTMIGGQPRNRIAKLSTAGTGAADATWNPTSNGTVYALALGNGALYVGGDFSMIGGQSRNCAAKLATGGTGAADASWNPGASGGLIPEVRALVVDGSGFVYAGGTFTMIGDQTRRDLAKLSGTGSGSADGTWDPSPNDTVRALALDGNGAVHAGGDFTVIGGQPRGGLARLASGGVGAADPGFNPNADDAVHALALDPAGMVHAGGAFSRVQAQIALGFARVTAGGNLLSSAYAQIPGIVYGIGRAADGSVYVGGTFSRANGLARRNVLKLTSAGQLDAAWDAPADDFVEAFAFDASSVYVAGAFTTIGGQSHGRVAKLAAGSGAPDPIWNPAADDEVEVLALDPGGALYAGGAFASIGGLPRSGLAKLATTGAGLADPAWNPAPGGSFPEVSALALDGAGALYVGGAFASIGGQTRANIAKLALASGAADAAWNPGTSGTVFELALANASVYACGVFSAAGGMPRANLAKFGNSGTGALDAGWNAGADSFVIGVAAEASGAIFAGGSFANIGGAPRARIAKLSGTGTATADPSWNPGANSAIFTLSTAGPGVVLAGGTFATIGGQGRRLLAALPSVVDGVFKDSFE